MNRIPWPKAEGIYASDGPRHDAGPVDFEIAGVEFRVNPTSMEGIHSMRTRYHVQCRTCMKTLHEATTGPTSRIRDHLKHEHDFKGELEHAANQAR